MWRFKENEEHIRMAAAGFIFHASKISKEKKRRFWVRLTFSKRKV
jgi:hypothetical protein